MPASATTAQPPAHQMSSRGPLIVSGAAVLLIGLGMTIFFTHRDVSGGAAVVGVSSYQPLETLSPPSPGGVGWSETAVAALGITVAGLLLLAGVAGFLIGRRRHRGPSAP